ncbi:MAG: hypothetical protein V4481_03890 [Patescibacteria group bacterium]
MTPAAKIRFVKNRIEDRVAISPKGPIVFGISNIYGDTFNIFSDEQYSILLKLEEEGYIRYLIPAGKTKVQFEMTGKPLDPFGLIAMNKGKVTRGQLKGIKTIPNAALSPAVTTFSVKIKDRKILVNDYVIAKPHAVGKNMSFFEYLYENAGKLLEREDMPEYVRNEVSGRSFTKVLNALGFTGEILKAFFPKRGKGSVQFRKSVSLKELADQGIDMDIFMKELGLAHTKTVRSSPV